MGDRPDKPDDLDAGWELSDEDLEQEGEADGYEDLALPPDRLAPQDDAPALSELLPPRDGAADDAGKYEDLGLSLDDDEELEPYDSDEATAAYRPEEVPDAVADYLARMEAAAEQTVEAEAGPDAGGPAEDVIVDRPPTEEPVAAIFQPPAGEEPLAAAFGSPADPSSEPRSSLDPDLLFDLGDDLEPPPAPSGADAPTADAGASPFDPLVPYEAAGGTGEVQLEHRVPMAIHHLMMIVAGAAMFVAGVVMMTIGLLRQ